MAELWSRLVRIDWWLLGAVTVLQMLSVVMMYGISPDRFQRQLIFAVAGIGVVLFFAFINYRYAQNYAYVLYGVGLVLLIGVLLFGQEIRGTTGWFVLFGITLQPVELVKILLVIVLARFFSDHTFQFNQWKYVAIAAGITLLYGGLVLLQPDLGSMAVFTIAFFGSLLLTNIRWRQVSIIAITATIVIILGWFFFLNDIQQARITTFIDPTADPLDQGYNVTQSIISVGSGQWFGRGLGLGTQSQLRFLPERETDFIFAVIAEELGFLGAGSVIALLGIVHGGSGMACVHPATPLQCTIWLV